MPETNHQHRPNAEPLVRLPNLELTPGIPILPPSSRHLIASRADLETRFPVRAEILRRFEEQGYSIPDLEFARMATILQRLNSLDCYVDAHRTGDRTVLRDGQMQAFESSSRFFESGGREGYIKLPPRTGKTVLFIELVQALSLLVHHERVLIVAPSKILVEQTKARFTQFAPHMNVGLHYSDNQLIDRNAKHQKSSHGREERLNWSNLPEVTITTRDSLRNLERHKVIRPGDFKLIIFDEGHEMLGPKSSRAIDRLRHEDTWMVFVTATPKYSEEKSLKNFVGPEIHSMTIHEAISLGLLTPFSVITAETNIDLTDVAVDPETGYSQRELQSRINTLALNKGVLDLYKSPEIYGRSGIVFSSGVEHAKELAKIFKDAGISAEAIWGAKTKTEQAENARKIAAHQDGSVKVLIGPKLLGTGYDNPKVSVVIMTVPFTSPVPVEQFSTRCLTPDPNDPNKSGLIIQFLHHDRNTQRRQMTFLDCVYGAHVSRYERDLPRNSASTANRPIPAFKVEGLSVTTTPSEVIKVLAKRPDPIPSHPVDDAQSELRELRRRKSSILLATPAALREMVLLAKEARSYFASRSDQGKDATLLYRNLRTLRGRMKIENAQALHAEFSEKMLYYRRITQSEAIRHFLRRSDTEIDTEKAQRAAEASLRKRHAQLEGLLLPLQSLAEPHGVSPDQLLAAFDTRIRSHGIDQAWTNRLGTPELASLRLAIAKHLQPILSWEERAAMRWDVTRALYRELREIERRTAALEKLDWTTSTMSFAEERVASFIERYRREHRLRIDDELPLEPDELLQIGRIAALETLSRPKVLTSNRKFSRVASEAIEETLLRALTESETFRFSFTPGDRKMGFRTFGEAMAAQHTIERFKLRHGFSPTHEELIQEKELGAHLTPQQMAESQTIQPLGRLPRHDSAYGFNHDGKRERIVDSLGACTELASEEQLEAEHERLCAAISAARSNLDYRQQTILDERLLCPDQPTTIIELGQRFRLSKQAILNAERKILQLLAEPRYGLEEYYLQKLPKY